MTEEEAKTKWCPFVRYVSTQGDWFTNREDFDTEKRSACIASACMAWRFLHTTDRDANKHGFCGIAGERGKLI